MAACEEELAIGVEVVDVAGVAVGAVGHEDNVLVIDLQAAGGVGHAVPFRDDDVRDPDGRVFALDDESEAFPLACEVGASVVVTIVFAPLGDELVIDEERDRAMP